MLRIQLLGKMEVTVAGAPIGSVRGKSGLWLLGILTLRANLPVDREWLAGVLWPDSSPELGRANLRRALTDLRHALGNAAAPRLLNPTPHTVSLEAREDEADVLRFRAGETEQYTGELMPGCPLEWVETERRVLHETYLSRGEKQAASLDPTSALALLHKLRSHAPLRESLLRLELSALCQQGNRAEAQQAYHAFRRSLLEQRLGEPSIQTQEHWKTLQSLPTPAPATTPVPAVPAPFLAASPLPTPLTPFLGRKSEIEAVTRLLAHHRLVTLTGLGGMGKTRLALEAALVARRAVFLELAECRDAKTLIEAFQNLPPQHDDEPTLLVLDNFEQLVGPEANRAVRTLLEKQPHLRCLVTSRRSLGLTGEQVFPLQPLDLPQHHGLPERLREFASMALLVERARALRPTFELTPQNAPALVGLCQQAEGIPLAIELLAAHLRSLSPETLLTLVQQARLPLLSRASDGETPRHQSLWRIIESSVALLHDTERMGLWQISVFRGGWSLEAAQAVCGNSESTPPDPLFLVSLLETLADNAFIRFANGRYSQLETLRQWSLATQPDAVRAKARRDHASFFLGFAEKHANILDGLPFLDGERDNLLAAFDTFLTNDDTASALRWARALRPYWYHRQGGVLYLETLLARLEEAGERAEVQENLGVLCAMNGTYEAANRHLNEALAHFRNTGDTLAQGKILSNLAGMAIERGELDAARTGLEQALGLWRTLNHSRGIGLTLTNLSIVAMNQGDLNAAEPLINEALLLREAQGDRYGVATGLVNRGSLELRRGAPEKAQATYQEALHLFQEIQDRRGEASALEGLVEAFLDQNQTADALRFFQEAAWLRREYHLPLTALQMPLHSRIQQALKEAAQTANR